MSVYCLTYIPDSGLSINLLSKSLQNIDKSTYRQQYTLPFVDKTILMRELIIYKSIYVFM